MIPRSLEPCEPVRVAFVRVIVLEPSMTAASEPVAVMFVPSTVMRPVE